MDAEDYLEHLYSKGYYDNSRELQNKNKFNEKPFIQFKNVDEFNEISNSIFAHRYVIGTNDSEMIIYFNDNESLNELECFILWNHISKENLIIERIK